MRALLKPLLLVFALNVIHSTALALTIYTTFGQPGDTYNFASGWLVNGSANPPQPFVGEAFAFTAAGSGYLNRINLAISAGSTNLSKDLANVFLADNGGGIPGMRLETFLMVASSGPFGAANPLTSLNSMTTPMLVSGQTYWLCVEPALPTAAVVVNQNSLGIVAPQAQEFSPSSWIARGNKTTFAFSVDVTPVPEPSAIALGAISALALMRPFVRRAPGHAQQCQFSPAKQPQRSPSSPSS